MSKHDAEGKFLDTWEEIFLGGVFIGEGAPGAAQIHYVVIKETLCTRSCNVLRFSIVVGTRKPEISAVQS